LLHRRWSFVTVKKTVSIAAATTYGSTHILSQLAGLVLRYNADARNPISEQAIVDPGAFASKVIKTNFSKTRFSRTRIPDDQDFVRPDIVTVERKEPS